MAASGLKYRWRLTVFLGVSSFVAVGIFFYSIVAGFDDYAYLGVLVGAFGMYVSLIPSVIRLGYSRRRRYHVSDVPRLFMRGVSPSWRELWEDEDVEILYAVLGAVPVFVSFLLLLDLSNTAARALLVLAMAVLLLAAPLLAVPLVKQYRHSGSDAGRGTPGAGSNE
ncbi:hypothetical protein FHE66_14675 [Georgenia sp. 311]|uniref:hypothetical protein n=1 Tax=Georgenia sp. 311 TaxID=2585134 RepID=UPI0011127C3B|nr:hypothetical protein [Georgenia sp. 311]TNC16618.1 hypothetical protein FHE66_14675 [Georgenia sp. 311]